MRESSNVLSRLLKFCRIFRLNILNKCAVLNLKGIFLFPSDSLKFPREPFHEFSCAVQLIAEALNNKFLIVVFRLLVYRLLV